MTEARVPPGSPPVLRPPGTGPSRQDESADCDPFDAAAMQDGPRPQARRREPHRTKVEGGKVCPARTRRLDGPNGPSEDGRLPLPPLAGRAVNIAICETQLRQMRQVSGHTTRN